jgi:hypothetical protein
MLQVDLFWVYAIGAMFATAAAKQLKKEKNLLGNAYLAALLFYISVIFVPEALWLLWSFPQWETMHVWKSLGEIPTAYVTAFISGDALLAVIGFWVAAKLIKSGRDYSAHLQWLLGYFAFFFVLIHGWDGTGWQRFTWDTTVTGVAWEEGMTMGADFIFSNVAITLYAMAFPTIGPMIVGGYIWIKKGHMESGLDEFTAKSLARKGIALYLIGVFVSLIIAALATAISIYLSTATGGIGAVLGLLVALTVFYLIFRTTRVQNEFVRTFNLIT